MIEKVNVDEKFGRFSDCWNPRIAAELNGQHVKLVRLKGEFVWHKHDDEDELFYVIKGTLHMHFRDGVVTLTANEFIVVPRGVEHKPVTDEETLVMLFEPASTLNTGDVASELTRNTLEKI
jgi:mannose-6-phosphate isomerase-like protein (cupin superfamily)